MKKITSFLAVAAMAVSANAGVYIAYEENFDNVATAEAAGWLSQFNQGGYGMVEHAGNGKALAFTAPTNAGRSYYKMWGAECWANVDKKNAGTDNYTVAFQFSLSIPTIYEAAQRSMSMSICADLTRANEANSWYNYALEGKNPLFTMCMLPDPESQNTLLFYVNRDSAQVASFESAAWYNFKMTVDTVARKAYTLITSVEGAEVVKTTYEIPEGQQVLPTGIYGMGNRQSSKAIFDNIIVGKEVEGEVPTTPSALISAIANEYVQYSFTFKNGEKLKYKVTGCEAGTLLDSEFEGELPLEGSFEYSSIEADEAKISLTQSGHVDIWTERAGGESDHVEFDVEVKEVVLPEPEVVVISVKPGYEKEYQINIDNSNVPTKPALFFNYKFTSVTGEVTYDEKATFAAGSKITVPGAGVMKVWAVYPGFTQSEEVTIQNDQSYKIDSVIDFEHMSAEECMEHGFVTEAVLEQTDNCSGFNSWSGRQGYYDWIVKFNADTQKNDTTKFLTRTFTRYQLPANTADSAQADTFTHLRLWCGAAETKNNQLSIMKQVGLLDETTAVTTRVVGLRDMGDNDYAIAYEITNYCRNDDNSMRGGYYASEEEALAADHGFLFAVVKGNGSINVYRIQDSLTKVEFLTPGESVEIVVPGEDVKEDAIPGVKYDNEKEANAPVYNLRGEIVNPNHLTRGIYFQNGKKFLVK